MLNEAKKNLTSFKLGTDGLSSTVIIRNVIGKEFKPIHNIIIKTALATLLEVLNSKIAEVEEQINFAV